MDNRLEEGKIKSKDTKQGTNERVQMRKTGKYPEVVVMVEIHRVSDYMLENLFKDGYLRIRQRKNKLHLKFLI